MTGIPDWLPYEELCDLADRAYALGLRLCAVKFEGSRPDVRCPMTGGEVAVYFTPKDPSDFFLRAADIHRRRAELNADIEKFKADFADGLKILGV